MIQATETKLGLQFICSLHNSHHVSIQTKCKHCCDSYLVKNCLFRGGGGLEKEIEKEEKCPKSCSNLFKTCINLFQFEIEEIKIEEIEKKEKCSKSCSNLFKTCINLPNFVLILLQLVPTSK